MASTKIHDGIPQSTDQAPTTPIQAPEVIWNQRKVTKLTAASACKTVVKVIAFAIISLAILKTALALAIPTFYSSLIMLAAIPGIAKKMFMRPDDRLILSGKDLHSLYTTCKKMPQLLQLYNEAVFDIPDPSQEQSDSPVSVPVNAFALLRLQEALFDPETVQALYEAEVPKVSTEENENLGIYTTHPTMFLMGDRLPVTHEREKDTHYIINLTNENGTGSTVAKRLIYQKTIRDADIAARREAKAKALEWERKNPKLTMFGVGEDYWKSGELQLRDPRARTPDQGTRRDG